MKLIFVRHGNAEGQLTHLGKKQARLICYDLNYEQINKIYTSPLPRTLQTAKIISKQLKINEVIIDKRLSEREKINNRLTPQEKEIYNSNYLNPNYFRQNPEGCGNYIKRIFDFLDDVINNNSNDSTILIVGHSSMVYAINAYVYGFGKDGNVVWTRLGNCSKICYEI